MPYYAGLHVKQFYSPDQERDDHGRFGRMLDAILGRPDKVKVTQPERHGGTHVIETQGVKAAKAVQTGHPYDAGVLTPVEQNSLLIHLEKELGRNVDTWVDKNSRSHYREAPLGSKATGWENMQRLRPAVPSQFSATFDGGIMFRKEQ